MYLKHWKLTRRPFDERINTASYFAAASHEQTLSRLRTAIGQRASLSILAGAAGCGKSTLAAVLAATLPEGSCLVAHFPVAPRTASDLVHSLHEQLCRLNRPSDRRAKEAPLDMLLADLRGIMQMRAPTNGHAVVLIDAAEHLAADEIASLVRSITAFTVGGDALLTAIVIGSSEFLVRAQWAAPWDMEMFPQCVLAPLSQAETIAYIGHHVRHAGGDPGLFSTDALGLIHELSGGLARRINRLCDMSLIVAFAQDSQHIEPSHVWTAQQEIKLLAATRTATGPMTRQFRPLRRPAPAAAL